MSLFRFAGTVLVVSLLVATSMYALNTALKSPVCPRSHVLFIDNGADEYSQRMVAGARAAAQQFGVDLEVETPTADNLVDQQISIGHRINLATYVGVAFSPADPQAQIELINQLARDTKLVTIDRDCDESRRLCHVAFSQSSAGGVAANLVRNHLPHAGKVAIVATSFSDGTQNVHVSERLAGFKEMWGLGSDTPDKSCRLVQTATESSDAEQVSPDLAAALVDPNLAFIVALDTKAAESALKAMAARSGSRQVPIVAFDPNKAIFDAIEDGRVFSAIFDDPYRSGFIAVQRLSEYGTACGESLPVPGYGGYFIVSEVVSKENLADFRRRTRS